MFDTETSEVGLWVSLVKLGETRASVHLPEELESYTVFMLMRNVCNQTLLDEPVALLFLESIDKKDELKKIKLAKAGDQSLLIAGLFPERARRARVSPDYFLSMSQVAYTTLSDVCEKTRKYREAMHYATIAHNAEKIASVLSHMRPH